MGEKPTERAVTEHFVKIKASLAKSGATPVKHDSAVKPGPARKRLSAGTPTKQRKKQKVKSEENESDDNMSATPNTPTPVQGEVIDLEDGAAQGGAIHPTITPRKKMPVRQSKTPEARARLQDYIKNEINDDGDATSQGSVSEFEKEMSV